MKRFIHLIVFIGLILCSCQNAPTSEKEYNSVINDLRRYYSQYMILSDESFNDIITNNEIQFYLDSIMSITDRALNKFGDQQELLKNRIEALNLLGRNDEASKYINRLTETLSINPDTPSQTSINKKTEIETDSIDNYVIKMQSLILQYDMNSNNKCYLDSVLDIADRAINDVGYNYRIFIEKLYALDRLNRYDEAIDELSESYNQCINDSVSPISTAIFTLRFKAIKALTKNDSISYNKYMQDIIHINETFMKKNQQSISEYINQPFLNDSTKTSEYSIYMRALTSYYYYYSILYSEDASIALINQQLANSQLKPSFKATVRTLYKSYDSQRFAPI